MSKPYYGFHFRAPKSGGYVLFFVDNKDGTIADIGEIFWHGLERIPRQGDHVQILFPADAENPEEIHWDVRVKKVEWYCSKSDDDWAVACYCDLVREFSTGKGDVVVNGQIQR